MDRKTIVSLGLLGSLALLLAACAGAPGEPGPVGPAGPAGPPGPPGPALTVEEITCTQCHNDTSIITSKRQAWSESIHGSGESIAYAGGREGCAGCHSGAKFKEMIAAGLTPDKVEGGDSAPTHQDCRTCHQIHTSYTAQDWALTTTAPVVLFAFEDQTYDGGAGNLCGVCHQPHRLISAPDAEGNIEVDSTHWGPHLGPQTAMMLGVGGAGETKGAPSAHYMMAEETCVSCHLGENDNHLFEPAVAACTGCHDEAKDLDINGTQTEVETLLAELEGLLVAKGMWEDHPVVGVYPAAEAQAMWNYLFILEDSSRGVHNPNYTRALLEASIAALQ